MKKKSLLLITALLLMSFLLGSCSKQEEKLKSRNAYYEIFVASFRDSDGDGMGDLNGVTQRLDYLQELGVGGIWLMPIMPSQTYHKYDVDDYYSVDKSYGTMEDFENLIKEAEKRKIDIIIDLPINHTSDTHPWFVEAKESFLSGFCGLGKSTCAYYNFESEAKPGYAKLDEEHYYEAVFWEGMPDLNLDNPHLREEIKDIAYFWLDKGVKGFRLDAVLHFYESNPAKNNAFVEWFMEVVNEKRPDAYVVGEVWASDTLVTEHYRSGIDSMFRFDLSGPDGAVVKAIRTGQGEELASRVMQNRQNIREINSLANDSLFLSNHDQARSAGFFKNEEERKLMASAYLVMPGTPFIYYGEEIGIRGSGKDENKRLPMLWGEGADCEPPKDADYTAQVETDVKGQLNDEASLLTHYRRVLKLRNNYLCKDMEVFEYRLHEQVQAYQYDDYVVMVNMGKTDLELSIKGKLLDKVDILGETKKNSDGVHLAAYGLAILELP